MIFKDIDEIGAECARLRTEEKNIQHYFIMAKKPPCECIVIESRKLYELLRNASVAIDAERVRHGHWVKIDLRPRNLFYYCNLCRSNAQAITKYCPNCGAKMDEENKNACNKRNA